MTKKELKNISFETVNEIELKLKLSKYIAECGFDKALSLFTFKNKLLLTSCDIDENLFNKILFKNYIFYINNQYQNNTYKLPNNDDETITMFNYYIENNNFKEAFNIFENSNTVYQTLCILYVNDINKSDFTKINKIKDENINDVYDKLSILNNLNLTFKRDNIKIYQKVSTR